MNKFQSKINQCTRKWKVCKMPFKHSFKSYYQARKWFRKFYKNIWN